jgi:hypothetical protein
MGTIMRLGIQVSLVAVTAFGALPGITETSVEVRPDVTLFGATAEQIDIGRWAARRFENAGLRARSISARRTR